MKVSFLCIGVQKAGTTSLINYLNQSPQIFMGKEMCYWNKPKHGKLMPVSEYERSFKTNKPIIGHNSPSCCLLQYALDRIHDYNPNMKLILILREPISRAYSEYNMYLDWGKIKQFSDNDKELDLKTLTTDGPYFILRGFYDEQLEYIFMKFPRKNIHIAISEEVKSNKQEEYGRMFEFLGVERMELDTTVDTHIRHYPKIPTLLESKLYDIYRPHVLKLYEMLGRKIEIWENYYRKIGK